MDLSELPTSVRLTREVKAGLQRRAEAEGRKLTDYIRNVLRLHVETRPTGRGQAKIVGV